MNTSVSNNRATVTFKPTFCFQEKGRVAKIASGIPVQDLREMKVCLINYKGTKNYRLVELQEKTIKVSVKNRHGMYVILGDVLKIETPDKRNDGAAVIASKFNVTPSYVRLVIKDSSHNTYKGLRPKQIRKAYQEYMSLRSNLQLNIKN